MAQDRRSLYWLNQPEDDEAAEELAEEPVRDRRSLYWLGRKSTQEEPPLEEPPLDFPKEAPEPPPRNPLRARGAPVRVSAPPPTGALPGQPHDPDRISGLPSSAPEPPFDPEGEGYDYATAQRYGIRPDESGHWPSRAPETGQLLKGRKHPTYSETLEGEAAQGYEVFQGQDGRWYSQPVKRRGTWGGLDAVAARTVDAAHRYGPRVVGGLKAGLGIAGGPQAEVRDLPSDIKGFARSLDMNFPGVMETVSGVFAGGGAALEQAGPAAPAQGAPLPYSPFGGQDPRHVVAGALSDAAGSAIGKASGVLRVAGREWDRLAQQTRKRIAKVYGEEKRPLLQRMKEDPAATIAQLGAENAHTMVVGLGAALAAGPVLALPTMFAQEAAGAYREAIAAGAPEEQALKAAGATGFANAFLEYAPLARLVNRSGIPQKVFKPLWKRMVTDGLFQAGAEIPTELAQTITQRGVALATWMGNQQLGPEDWEAFTSPEMQEQLWTAALAALGLGGGAGTAKGALDWATGPRPPAPTAPETLEVPPESFTNAPWMGGEQEPPPPEAGPPPEPPAPEPPPEPERPPTMPQDRRSPPPAPEARPQAPPQEPGPAAPEPGPVPEQSAIPLEAMEHAGSGASPEAKAREEGGTRFYEVSPEGQVLPLIGQDAVDRPPKRGWAKVRKSPNGEVVVEHGKLSEAGRKAFAAAQAVVQEARERVAQRPAEPEPEPVVVEPAETDEAFLGEIGVKRPAEKPPAAEKPRHRVEIEPVYRGGYRFSVYDRHGDKLAMGRVHPDDDAIEYSLSEGDEAELDEAVRAAVADDRARTKAANEFDEQRRAENERAWHQKLEEERAEPAPEEKKPPPAEPKAETTERRVYTVPARWWYGPGAKLAGGGTHRRDKGLNIEVGLTDEEVDRMREGALAITADPKATKYEKATAKAAHRAISEQYGRAKTEAERDAPLSEAAREVLKERAANARTLKPDAPVSISADPRNPGLVEAIEYLQREGVVGKHRRWKGSKKSAGWYDFKVDAKFYAAVERALEEKEAAPTADATATVRGIVNEVAGKSGRDPLPIVQVSVTKRRVEIRNYGERNANLHPDDWTEVQARVKARYPSHEVVFTGELVPPQPLKTAAERDADNARVRAEMRQPRPKPDEKPRSSTHQTSNPDVKLTIGEHRQMGGRVMEDAYTFTVWERGREVGMGVAYDEPGGIEVRFQGGTRGVQFLSDIKAAVVERREKKRGSTPKPDEKRGRAEPNERVVATGKTTKARTPKGDLEVGFRWVVRKIADVVTSHDSLFVANPLYTGEQPRQREGVAYQDQVDGIARELRPEDLGADRYTDRGAPTATDRGVIESGNGRSMAIRRAYEKYPEKARAYFDWLVEHAAEFGIDPAALRFEDQPILLRERTQAVDEGEFARASNEGVSAGMGDVDQARVDADRLSSDDFAQFRPGDAGDITSAANRDFVRTFIERAGKGQGLEDTRGQLSPKGIRRIQNALMAAAYKSDLDLLNALLEHADEDLKLIGRALLDVSPMVALMQKEVASGQRQMGEHDLVRHLLEAVAMVRDLRLRGINIKTYLGQHEIGGPQLSEESRDILGFLDKNKRSWQRMAEGLHQMVAAVEHYTAPNQYTLSMPSLRTIIKEAMTPAQASVFGDLSKRRSRPGPDMGGARQAKDYDGPFGWVEKEFPKLFTDKVEHAADAKSAYREIVGLSHPDRQPNEEQRARGEEFMKAANNAYEGWSQRRGHYAVDDVHRLRQLIEHWKAGLWPDGSRTGKTQPPPHSQQQRTPPPPRGGQQRPPPGGQRPGGQRPPPGGARQPPPGGQAPPPGAGPGPSFSSEPQPRRGAQWPRDAKNPQRLVGLWLPELVEMIEMMSNGKIPVRIKKNLRGQGVLGRYLWRVRGGAIELRADLPKNMSVKELAALIAHEIGHWVDDIGPPNAGNRVVWQRGNILGRLASLSKWTKHTIDQAMVSPSKAFTKAEREQWEKDAWHIAGAQGFKGQQRKDRARDLYRKRVQSEMERRGLVDIATARAELIALSVATWGPYGPKDAEYRERGVELYADFVSALFTNPNLAIQHAPTATTLWWNYLSNKPQYAATYLELLQRAQQTDVERMEHLWQRLVGTQKLGIIDSLRAQAERGKTLGDWSLIDDATKYLTDRKHAAYRLAKRRARKTAWSRLLGESKPEAQKDPAILLFEEQSYSLAPESAHVYDFMEMVLRPIRAAGIADAVLSAYLGVRRFATERRDIWNSFGINGEIADGLRAHALKEFGPQATAVLEQALRSYWALTLKDTIKPLVSSGLLTPALKKKLLNNPNYARLAPLEIVADAEAKGGTSAFQPIKAQLGYLGAPGSFLYETIMHHAALRRMAHRNRLATEWISLIRDVQPEALEATRTDARGRYLARDAKGNSDKMHTVFYHVDGVLRAVDMPWRYAEIVERHLQFGPVAAWFQSSIGKMVRSVLVTHNPPWALWNIVRDSFGMAKQVVLGGGPISPARSAVLTAKFLTLTFKDAWDFVIHEKQGPLVQRALRARAILPARQRLYDLMDVNGKSEEDLLNEVLANFGAVLAEHEKERSAIRRVWDALALPGELSEKWVKLAAWRYLETHNLRQLSPVQRPQINMLRQQGERASLRAKRVRTRAGTPDTLRRGAGNPLTNAAFLFSNVNKEGLRSAWETFRERPLEYIYKTLAYTTIAPYIVYAGAKGLFGSIFAAMLEDVPESDRETYFVIPWYRDRFGRVVYSRVPFDHVGQLVHQLGAQAMKGARGDLDLDDVWEVLLQTVPWSPGTMHPWSKVAFSWLTYLKSGNPTDFFYGDHVIDDDIHRAAMEGDQWAIEERRRQMAYYIWNELGGRSLWAPHGSPPLEDTAIGEILGMPGIGPLAGRLVRVSNRGAVERIVEAEKKIARETGEPTRSGKAVRREKVVRQLLEADSNATAGDVQRALRELDSEYSNTREAAEAMARLKRRMSANAIERYRAVTTGDREELVGGLFDAQEEGRLDEAVEAEIEKRRNQ